MLSNDKKQQIATILSELNNIVVPEHTPISDTVRDLKIKLEKLSNLSEKLSEDEISELLKNIQQILSEADKLNSKDLEIFQILDDITPQN
jgi:peptide subunit release factor 1 (eRF1)